MHYTEEEIWRLTPKKFKSQLDVHEDIQKRMNGNNNGNPMKGIQNQVKQQANSGYIDQLAGW